MEYAKRITFDYLCYFLRFTERKNKVKRITLDYCKGGRGRFQIIWITFENEGGGGLALRKFWMR